jgi:hypothetical protein
VHECSDNGINYSPKEDLKEEKAGKFQAAKCQKRNDAAVLSRTV